MGGGVNEAQQNSVLLEEQIQVMSIILSVLLYQLKFILLNNKLKDVPTQAPTRRHEVLKDCLSSQEFVLHRAAIPHIGASKNYREGMERKAVIDDECERKKS